MDQIYYRAISIPCQSIPCPKDFASSFCAPCCYYPFNILLTRLCICPQIASLFLVPWFNAFYLATRYPFYQVKCGFIPAIQKSFCLTGLTVGVVWTFRPPALMWQTTRYATMTPTVTDEKSPLDSNTQRETSLLFVCIPNKRADIYITSYCASGSAVCTWVASLFSFVTISARQYLMRSVFAAMYKKKYYYFLELNQQLKNEIQNLRSQLVSGGSQLIQALSMTQYKVRNEPSDLVPRVPHNRKISTVGSVGQNS